MILFHIIWNKVYFTLGAEGDTSMSCRKSFAEADWKLILKKMCLFWELLLVVLTWAELFTHSISEVKAILDSFNSFSLDSFYYISCLYVQWVRGLLKLTNSVKWKFQKFLPYN